MPETKDTFSAGFEWDERKRQANLAKHGIDFAGAARVFDGPVVDPWWREQLQESGVVVPPDVRKRRVSLLLDEDVITWFRRLGRDHQHAINQFLRRHMQDKKRRKHDTAAE